MFCWKRWKKSDFRRGLAPVASTSLAKSREKNEVSYLTCLGQGSAIIPRDELVRTFSSLKPD